MRSKTCPYCKKDFADTSLKNSMKFCSDGCRRKAKVIRKAEKEGKEPPQFLDEVVSVCGQCTKEFTPSAFGQMYCSIPCRGQKYLEDRYDGVPEYLSRSVKCLECGEEFSGCVPHGGRSGKHLDSHNMTTQKYLDKYPKASIYSEAAQWKMRNADRVFPEDFSERCRDAQLRRYESDAAANLDMDLSAILAKTQSIDMSKASDNEILDYYRIRGFPFPRYSSTQIKDDFDSLCHIDVNRLVSVKGDVVTQKRTGLGMKAPNMFSRHFWEARRVRKASCIEAFLEDTSLLAVIRNRKKYAARITDATMRTGLKIHVSAPSSFPSIMAKFVYDRYLSGPSRVLDPCIGYGGRMVGSQSLPFPVEYVGYDPWVEGYQNVREMRDWFQWNCLIHNCPFEEAALDGEFDLVFTSPPHFNKEIYTEDKTQSVVRYPDYKAWMDGFMTSLVQKSFDHLRPDGHIVLHLSDVGMVKDTEAIMHQIGLSTSSLRWEQESFLSGKRFEVFLVGKKS